MRDESTHQLIVKQMGGYMNKATLYGVAAGFGIGIAMISITASAVDQAEVVNDGRYPIEVEIRTGETGATSCSENSPVTTRKLQSGESFTLTCSGQVGYCYRKRLYQIEGWHDDWYGFTCGGLGRTKRVPI